MFLLEMFTDDGPWGDEEDEWGDEGEWDYEDEVDNSPAPVAPVFVNSQIDKDQWNGLGRGATASIWQHMSDPNTVVKVVGGGHCSAYLSERDVSIAFVEFCVDHGWESKHFPIIYGINVDDPMIVQIRIEKLEELDGEEVGACLEDLADCIDANYNVGASTETLQMALEADNMAHNNSAVEIAKAYRILRRNAPIYAKKYKLENIVMDLHFANWMMRADGTIVAVDPWYSSE